jgi:hypothetical protein
MYIIYIYVYTHMGFSPIGGNVNIPPALERGLLYHSTLGLRLVKRKEKYEC